ncbi:MAG TPA: hypothetical protein VGY31_13440 [Terriglobia bacterium]|nr:hypothetical protein [Terriglobia bacterium]
MNSEKRLEIAKEYVDKQLEAMKQSGAAPKDMSAQEYKLLVQEIANAVQK